MKTCDAPRSLHYQAATQYAAFSALNVPGRIPLLLDAIKTDIDTLEAVTVICRVDTPTDWSAGLVVIAKA